VELLSDLLAEVFPRVSGVFPSVSSNVVLNAERISLDSTFVFAHLDLGGSFV